MPQPHDPSGRRIKVWVDDNLLIDDWSNHADREARGTISLKAGQRYPIKVEYYEKTVHATCKLFWSAEGPPGTPGIPKQIVPQEQLAFE